LLGISQTGAFEVLITFVLLNILLLLRLPLIVATQVRARPRIHTIANAIGTGLAIAVAPGMIRLLGPVAIPGMSVLIVVITIMVMQTLLSRLSDGTARIAAGDAQL
jgi:hypothetical protein